VLEREGGGLSFYNTPEAGNRDSPKGSWGVEIFFNQKQEKRWRGRVLNPDFENPPLGFF